jgi:predicted  nucleic acid-binding Zn-ribbon protein
LFHPLRCATLQAEAIASESTARAVHAEHALASVIKEGGEWKDLARTLEEDLEDVGRQLQAEVVAKEDAVTHLHQVVEEIQVEEDRLLDEIESVIAFC